MDSNRLLKISAWLYVAVLVALTLAHINWQAEIGNPFDIYRIVALCVAGCLARRAYPDSPSFAFLMIIGTVSALGFAHIVATGDNGSPFDIIIGMASGMWGVVLGGALRKIRIRAPFSTSAPE